MSEVPIKITLRAVRNRAGLSLAQTAELTGVSKAMLGQIERGESSPTIATLWKLAKGFHLPLSAFLQQPGNDAAPPEVDFPGSIGVRTIFPFDPMFGTETFVVTLQPGQEHISQGHESGVVEDVFVTEGQVEIRRGEDWIALDRGEGLRFAADTEHGYRNPGDTPASFHNVMHYPRRP